MITLQIYSAIINGALDPVPQFQSALYTLYRDIKLEFQYRSAIKMCGVLKFQHSMEYVCFMKQSNNQSGQPFSLKFSSKKKIGTFDDFILHH
jgi:hypothetical protein